MISPLASVDSTAKIGKNVTIQPFAYIEGCLLYTSDAADE